MMKEDDIIVYRSFENPNDAYIMQGVLENEGVPCFLSDENMTRILSYVGFGGVKLHIFERDKNLVDEILAKQGEDLPENFDDEK